MRLVKSSIIGNSAFLRDQRRKCISRVFATSLMLTTLLVFAVPSLAAEAALKTAPSKLAWNKQFPKISRILDSCKTSDGGFILVGSIDESKLINGAWCAKVNAKGSVVWEKFFKSRNKFFSVIQGNSGDFLLMNQDAILQIDTNGNLLKSQVLSKIKNPVSIVLAKDGAYLIATNPLNRDDKLQVSYVSKEGKVLWEKDLAPKGFLQGSIETIFASSDGTFLLAGCVATLPNKLTKNDVTFEEGAIFTKNGKEVPYPTENAWVAKIDKNGKELWQKRYGKGFNRIDAIVEDKSGDFIMAGITMDDRSISGYHDFFDGYMLRIDSKGKLKWQKAFGGSESDGFTAMTKTGDGSLLIAGSSGSKDGDLKSSLSSSNSDDGWLINVDSYGGLLWSKTYGIAPTDGFESIQLTDEGILLAGWGFEDCGGRALFLKAK